MFRSFLTALGLYIPSEPSNSLPEVILPDTLWLQIYSYLHPAQLIEFALLSKEHLRLSQQSEHFQSVVWLTMLNKQLQSASNSWVRVYEKAHPRQIMDYRKDSHDFYARKLSEYPENLKRIFLFMDLEDEKRLATELAKSPVTPDDLSTENCDKPSHLPDNCLCCRITKTRNPAIQKVFYDWLNAYYVKRISSLSYPNIRTENYIMLAFCHAAGFGDLKQMKALLGITPPEYFLSPDRYMELDPNDEKHFDFYKYKRFDLLNPYYHAAHGSQREALLFLFQLAEEGRIYISDSLIHTGFCVSRFKHVETNHNKYDSETEAVFLNQMHRMREEKLSNTQTPRRSL